MSLLPTADSAELPTAVAFLFDGSLIRVGPDVFDLTTTNPKALVKFPQAANATRHHNRSATRDSWEEVCLHDCFTVVCRRRIYREHVHDHDHGEREGRRVARMKQRMAANERSRTRSRSRLSSGGIRRSGAASPVVPWPDLLGRSGGGLFKSIELGNDDGSGSSSGYLLRDSDSDGSTDGSSGSQDMDNLSSAAVSCSSSEDELSSPPDYSSSDKEISESSSGSEPGGDDSDRAVNGSDMAEGSGSGDDDDASDATESSGYLRERGSDEGSHLEGLFSRILSKLMMSGGFAPGSSDDDSSKVYSEGESVSDHDDIHHAEPAPSNRDPEPGSVSIGRPKVFYLCDSCGRRCYRERYNCLECEEGRFDLCPRCKRDGRWCFDLTHKLYRITGEVLKGAISRRKCDIRQELIAYRTQTPGGLAGPYEVLFRFKKKYPVLLYNSPPIIHQKHDLVIWPLTNTRLLFGDLRLQKYYEQKIKAPGSKKCE